MKENKLKDMFERQKKLAGNFIPIENLVQGFSTEEERAKYLQTYWQLLIEEGVEFLREIPSRKFWRASSKGKKIDFDKLHEELVDIWHIVIALTLISGLSADELYEQYVKKNDTNFERVKNNL